MRFEINKLQGFFDPLFRGGVQGSAAAGVCSQSDRKSLTSQTCLPDGQILHLTSQKC
jgi:hypothetical protein